MIGAKIDVNKVNKTVKDRFALDNSSIRLDAVRPGQQPTINMINAKSHTRVGFRSKNKFGKSKPSKTAKRIEHTKYFFNTF